MNLFQWSESYNAKTIFDQVWESPYEWFVNYKQVTNDPWKVKVLVMESDDTSDLKWYGPVIGEDIDKVMIEAYKYINDVPPDHRLFRSFADWAEDLDAKDVDVILQLALFNEVRYS